MVSGEVILIAPFIAEASIVNRFREPPGRKPLPLKMA